MNRTPPVFKASKALTGFLQYKAAAATALAKAMPSSNWLGETWVIGTLAYMV